MKERHHKLLRRARAVVTGRAEHPAIVDCWSRTRPKYRRRAVVLLFLNALLFVALGVFTFWLRTGEALWRVGARDYAAKLWATFNPVAERQVTLSDFLLFPISLWDVPLQIVVVGLLLATLISIPILVAILYRFPFSMLFVAVVGFVALMPWLAITLSVSCLIAAARPFKFTFRYAYALIALLPVIVYLYLAAGNQIFNPTRATGSLAGVSPEELTRFAFPLVLAVLGACILMALVLLIARLVNYRPGAIAPLLAVMFAVPTGLFYGKVGRDELHYRLLEHECGPGSRVYFVDRDANEIIDRYADMLYAQDPDPLRDREAIRQNVVTRMKMEFPPEPIASVHHEAALEQSTAFASDQRAVVDACQRFLARFPKSRYVPNVLYLQGRALDLRVDLEAFSRTGMIRHYGEFPNRASREFWSTIVRQSPDSPVASVALDRLARLALRDRTAGVDVALGHLDTLLGRFDVPPATSQTAPAPGWRGLFAARPPTASLRLNLRRIVLEARKLALLIRRNRDPRLEDAPLTELFQLDPRHARYRENLAIIQRKYPTSKLADNLAVLRAAGEPSLLERVPALMQAAIDDYPGTDGAQVGLFHLALEHQRAGDRDQARERFQQTIDADASSPWADDARRRLQALGL